MPQMTLYIDRELEEKLRELQSTSSVSSCFKQAMIAWLAEQRPALIVDKVELRTIVAPRRDSSPEELLAYARDCIRNATLAEREADRRIASMDATLEAMEKAQATNDPEALAKALEQGKATMAKMGWAK